MLTTADNLIAIIRMLMENRDKRVALMPQDKQDDYYAQENARIEFFEDLLRKGNSFILGLFHPKDKSPDASQPT